MAKQRRKALAKKKKKSGVFVVVAGSGDKGVSVSVNSSVMTKYVNEKI